MTLETITQKLEMWQRLYAKKQAQLDKANERYDTEKERWNRLVNKLTPQMYKLKQKIEKAKPLASYYKREKESGMSAIDTLSLIACGAATLLIISALQKEIGDMVVAGLRYILKFLSIFDLS